jgi:hypothetical protein
MSSFENLLNRMKVLTEGKASPYTSSHPAFGGVTSKMRAKGLSSAPLDTIRFIREILYKLDIITHEELVKIKSAFGFSGKKQAMLTTLRTKQDEINAKSDEIASMVSDTLDDFINSVTTNRGQEEKYAARASAREMASQMRQTKSGKKMDDALTDIVSDETILVTSSVAKILADIEANLGEPGFDIEEEALSEVIEYSEKIDSLAKLKAFIKQLQTEPGYEKIAAYLSSAVGPITRGTEDEEMEEEAEEGDFDDFDTGQSEDLDPGYGDLDPGYGEELDIDELLRSGYEEFDFETEFDGDSGILTYWAKKDPTTNNISVIVSHGVAHNEIGILDGHIDRVVSNNIDHYESEALEDAKEKLGTSQRGVRTESYTSSYLTDQVKKDKHTSSNKDKSVTFKERYKPKTHWQLEELRRYGW